MRTTPPPENLCTARPFSPEAEPSGAISCIATARFERGAIYRAWLQAAVAAAREAVRRSWPPVPVGCSYLQEVTIAGTGSCFREAAEEVGQPYPSAARPHHGEACAEG